MMPLLSRGLYLMTALALIVGSPAFNVLHGKAPTCDRTRMCLDTSSSFRPPQSTPALRWGTRPRERGSCVVLGAKRKVVDRDDPEYQAVLARQRVLTEAMDVLTKYDEAQADFTSRHAESNAPLGDWCGYYKRLTAVERKEMREACRTLASEAAYVLLGLNAPNLEIARLSMRQWLEVCLCVDLGNWLPV